MNGVSLITHGIITPTAQTSTEVVYVQSEQPKPLVQALKLPLPKSMTQARGIHQSDIVIRTAIIMAIADLRANPWMLETVFNSLLCDAATASRYGEKERAQACEWFLRTDIPVVMDYTLIPAGTNGVSIALVDSTETNNTLGDVNYEPFEQVEAAWPPLSPVFNPVAYNSPTGIMQVAPEVTEALIVAPGMLVVDKTGKTWPIEEVHSKTTFKIQSGIIADFKGSVIKGKRPSLVMGLESLTFRETYRVGVHAHGEPHHLTWLHSIVYFCLLAYKQVLLEARGFESSVMSSSQFTKDERWGAAQNMWTRFITLTGNVRQTWPKHLTGIIQSGAIDDQSPLKVAGINNVWEDYTAPPNQTDPEWIAQNGFAEDVEDEE